MLHNASPSYCISVGDKSLFSVADDTAEALENLRAQCLSIVLPLTRGYIWQRDGFDLRSSAAQQPPWRQKRASGVSGRDASGTQRSSSSSSGLAGFREGPLPCLWGVAQFGDNLEDEWLVTWLLCELTARVPGTAARAWDNDGEFLLIEAAYSLPRWLKPETATNRSCTLTSYRSLPPFAYPKSFAVF